MSTKRAVLYGASLLLLAGVVYLAWPRSATRKSDTAAAGSAARAGQSSLGLGAVIRSGSGAGPRLAVSGTVRDAATGKGVAGVTLSFGGETGKAQSSPAGQYQLELPPGRYEVSLQAEEHAASLPRPWVLIPQDEPVSGLDFWLQRTGSVAGRVIDARGKPVAGAQVTVSEARGSGLLEAPSGPARSDGQGRFSLRVPPGEVALRAEAAAGAAASRRFYVQPGLHLTGVELQLGTGGTLEGRLLRPDGVPASQGEVLLKDEVGLRRLPCDQQGRFSAGGLTLGSKLVQGAARGYAPSQVSEVSVQTGPVRSLTLQLGKAKGVAGRVLSPEGAPIAGVRVTVRAGGPQGPMVQLSTQPEVLTDEAGLFQFLEVPDLPLTLTARGPGTSSTSRSGVAPGSVNVVLKLEATGSIVGLVTDGTGGKPVTDFTVTLTSGPGVGPGGERPALRVASGKGQFAIDALVPGSYAVSITAPGYGPAEKGGLSVVAGHAARADVTLDGGGRISGLVVDSRGAGVPGATVRADTGWLGAAVVSDASGAFLLRDVARGRRSLTATHPDYNTRVLGGVEVFPAATASVRVELAAREGASPGLNLSGIGATLTSAKGKVTVVTPMQNSPADIAGLRAGDQVVSVDGQEAGKLGFGAVVEALRGIAGTPVRIQVQRGAQTLELYIIRGEVKVP
jgi:hypothetical protein